MLKLLLLLMCLATVLARQVTTRLNYGAAFFHEGRITTAPDTWKHTFELTIPHVEYERLSTIPCNGVRQSPLCKFHNTFVDALNNIALDLLEELRMTHNNATQIMGTVFQIDPTTIDRQAGQNNLQSRSKRALLPFVGDLASGLFGVATSGQIDVLRRHINNIYKRQGQFLQYDFSNANALSSFMRKTNQRMHNLRQQVTDNHKFIDDLTTEIIAGASELDDLESELQTFMPILVKRATDDVLIRQQLDNFLLGLHELVQRRLPPLLIPHSALMEAIEITEAALQKRSSSYRVANRHAAYYYLQNDVMFAQVGRSFFITINIPISSNLDIYDLYQVRSFPVPLNHTTNHVTLVQDLPPYLAVSHERDFYLELSSQDFLRCSDGPIKHCPTLPAVKSTTNPTCALALYMNDVSPDPHCQFNVITNGLPTSVIEISPGEVLLSNVDSILYTCDNQVRREKGCLFCQVTVPCGCALAVGNYHISPRLSACSFNDGQVVKQYPVNLALLNQFFNNSAIEHITHSKTFAKPLAFSIPDMKVFDRKFARNQKSDKRLEADLKTVASKMKAGKIALADPLWDFDEPEDMATWNWQHILGYIAFVLTLFLLAVVFIQNRRMRNLYVRVAVLSNNPAIKTNAVAINTTMATLQWQSNRMPDARNAQPQATPSTCANLPQANDFEHYLRGFELICLALLLVVLIRWGTMVYNTMLYRSDVYLEITNGKTFVEIYLCSLVFCPSEYGLVLRYWINSLSLVKRMTGADDLLISWPKFELQEKRTGQVIQIPKTIRLSIFQWFRVKRIIKTNYKVYPKVVHGGRAFYMTLAKPSPTPTDNERCSDSDGCTNVLATAPSYPIVI